MRRRANAKDNNVAMMGTQQPSIWPNFRCLPDLVSGIPIFLEMLALTDDSPRARFHEKEKPNLRPRPMQVLSKELKMLREILRFSE
jgi:hypothetical protein